MSEQGKFFIIRTRTKQIVGSFQAPFGPFVFSPDGKLVYLGRTDLNVIQIPVIDVKERKIIRRIITDTDDHIRDPLYITPNGARLIVVSGIKSTAVINPNAPSIPVVTLKVFVLGDVHGFQAFSSTQNSIEVRNANTLNVIKQFR